MSILTDLQKLKSIKDIGSSMTGAAVADNLNEKVNIIYKCLVALNNNIKEKSDSGDDAEEQKLYSVSIAANPECSIGSYSDYEQTFTIPINVYYGTFELSYGTDNSGSTFSVDLRTGTIHSSDGTSDYGTVTPSKNDNGGLTLNVKLKAKVVGSFAYTFGIIYAGQTYNKTISFSIISNNISNIINITLTPSATVIAESTTKGVYNFASAISTYKVSLNGEDVTNNVQAELQTGQNCNGIIDTSAHQVQITGFTTNYPSACDTFQWTDLDGTQHSEYKATSGWLPIYVSYTDKDGITYGDVANFTFAVNYLGTFKESIINDIHTQVSEKVVNELSSGDTFITKSYLTEIYQDAERIALSAATSSATASYNAHIQVMADKIDSYVEEVGRYDSQITQTANEIKALTEDVEGNKAQIDINTSAITQCVKDISGNTSAIKITASGLTLIHSGLTKTGIDIEDGTITVSSDTFAIYDTDGEKNFLFGKDGQIQSKWLSGSTSAITMEVRDLETGLESAGIHLDGENSTITMKGAIEIHSGEYIDVYDSNEIRKVEITPNSVGSITDISTGSQYTKTILNDKYITIGYPDITNTNYTFNLLTLNSGQTLKLSNLYYKFTMSGTESADNWSDVYSNSIKGNWDVELYISNGDGNVLTSWTISQSSTDKIYGTISDAGTYSDTGITYYVGLRLKNCSPVSTCYASEVRGTLSIKIKIDSSSSSYTKIGNDGLFVTQGEGGMLYMGGETDALIMKYGTYGIRIDNAGIYQLCNTNNKFTSESISYKFPRWQSLYKRTIYAESNDLSIGTKYTDSSLKYDYFVVIPESSTDTNTYHVTIGQYACIDGKTITIKNALSTKILISVKGNDGFQNQNTYIYYAGSSTKVLINGSSYSSRYLKAGGIATYTYCTSQLCWIEDSQDIVAYN